MGVCAVLERSVWAFPVKELGWRKLRGPGSLGSHLQRVAGKGEIR